MHWWPLYSWLDAGDDSSVCFKNNIINIFLLLGKFSIDRKTRSNIRNVMMQLMPLVCQHDLSIDKPFIVIYIMQSSSSRSTSTNGNIRHHSSTEVFLLTIINKETFNLWLSLTRLYISHYIAMGFTCYLRYPSHYFQFFIIFKNSAFCQNIMHFESINIGLRTVFFNKFLIRYNSFKLWITICSKVKINDVWIPWFEPTCHLIYE